MTRLRVSPARGSGGRGGRGPPEAVQHFAVGLDPKHHVVRGGVVDEGALGVHEEHVGDPDLLHQPAVEGHAEVVGAREGQPLVLPVMPQVERHREVLGPGPGEPTVTGRGSPGVLHPHPQAAGGPSPGRPGFSSLLPRGAGNAAGGTQQEARQGAWFPPTPPLALASACRRLLPPVPGPQPE